MFRGRLVSSLLRVWLILSLVAGPFTTVVTAHAAGTAAPAVASMTGDHAHHMDSAAHGDHGQPRSGDMHHDSCNGPCCASCVHCVVVTSPAMDGLVMRVSVLTPREPRLFSFAFISLRERPPRVLSV
jgi:hypothetical protein